MNKEELIRNLKYEKEKHKNDVVPTFGTNISAMCFDVLRVLENCIEIPEGATNGDMIMAMFPNVQVVDAGIHRITVIFGDCHNMMYRNSYDEDWWNALYKKGVE